MARRNFHVRLLSLTLLVLGGMLLPGMNVSAQDAVDPLATRVRFVHAGTDQGKIEIHINGDEVLDEFEYGDVSDWIDFEPGAVRLTITHDRVGFNYSIFDSVYPVLAGNDYQVVISDMLVLSSVIDRSPVADAGARVRVVQGSVDLPPVNVVASGDTVNFGTQLLYSTNSDAVIVPAGTYDVEVRLAGSGDVLLAMPGLVFEADMTYDLVIMGAAGSDDHPLSLLQLSDSTVDFGLVATPSA